MLKARQFLTVLWGSEKIVFERGYLACQRRLMKE